MVRPPLSAILSFNGGYVDTMGFLALTGLFTAHVTGNFVTLGAVIALGTGGAIAKILALPVFCIVVLLVRLLDLRLESRGRSACRSFFQSSSCCSLQPRLWRSVMGRSVLLKIWLASSSA